MDTIFMNSKKCKTSNLYRILLKSNAQKMFSLESFKDFLIERPLQLYEFFSVEK